MTAVSIALPTRSFAARLAAYVELTKPKIALLELATVATGAFLAGLKLWPLAAALLGTALVAASASALNQWLERATDGLMPRTADRPLPSGRLTGRETLLFGFVTGVAGVGVLLAGVNLRTAALGVLSWLLYVVVYTPLKTRTTLNTFVGALSGALPILMGWSAMERSFDLTAGTLYLVVFLWQFPHFMAIAWLYREQYGAAGIRMLPVVEPTGVCAGGQAVLAVLVLIPVSLIPAVAPTAGPGRPAPLMHFSSCTALLGIGQLMCAIRFLARLDAPAARTLLHASLVYLPGLLVLLACLLPAR